MTDAGLIYNALLRAEKRAEVTRDVLKAQGSPDAPLGVAVYLAIQVIREEIGNGMAAWQSLPPDTPAGLDAISGKVD